MGGQRRPSCVSALLVTLAFLAGSARAMETEMTFVFGFPGFSDTKFPECGQMHIKLGTQPRFTVPPKPPYTLIAYEAGGLTTAQTLGSDFSDLVWTVNHKSGTQLALSMTDAAGNSGGVSPTIYTVFSNSSTTSSCHGPPANSSLSFKTTLNATGTLNTCDVLPLSIQGGKPPYAITIASTVDAMISNVTMDFSYDTYHWVNKAAPNSSLIVSVSDADKHYAPQTLLLKTKGGLGHTCSGMLSMQLDSTGKGSPVPLGNPNDNSTTSNPSKGITTGPIIGGVLGGLAVIGGFITAVFYLFFRKRNAAPRPFLDEDGAYTESGLRGIRPFQVDSTNASAPTRATSWREKALPLPPGSEGEEAEEGPAVYQHADINDVLELPPAYRDRAAISHLGSGGTHPHSFELSQ